MSLWKLYVDSEGEKCVPVCLAGILPFEVVCNN